jgi:hypothetical protein
MKVVLKARCTGMNIYLYFDSYEEKNFILDNIIHNVALSRFIFDEMSNSGPLGREIYSKFYDNRHLITGFAISKRVQIDLDVISEQSLNDLSRTIARAFAEAVSSIVDNPDEYNLELYNKTYLEDDYAETVDEITLPVNVIRELERRGVDPTYKCEVQMSRRKGYSYVFVENKYTYSQDIALVSSDIDGDCNIGYNFHLFRYRYFIDPHGIINVSAPNFITILPLIYKPDYPVHCYDFNDSLRDKYSTNTYITDIAKVREMVLEDIQRIKKGNFLNLFVAAAYNKAYNKECKKTHKKVKDSSNCYTLSYTNTIKVPYGEIEINIKRKWLLSQAGLSLKLHLLDDDYRNTINNSKEPLVIEYTGKGIKVIDSLRLNPANDREYYIIGDYPSYMLPLESKYLVYSRYRRILEDDFSVIDEIIETDKQLIRSIEEQIKRKPPHLIELGTYMRRKENRWNKIPAIDAVANMYDFMTQEQKEKFIAYLVTQKLKKSMEAE